MVYYNITDIVDIIDCLNKLKQDIKLVAKALALSEPMAIFYSGHGKW